MAQIRVDDTVYNLLKDAADKDYRTIGGEIEYLLRNRIELSEIQAALKNKKVESQNGSGSQANKEKPAAEHIGRREVKSVPQLIGEIELIKKRYTEEAEFCQDGEQLKNLQRNMEAEIAPIQAEIDELLKP